MSERSTETPRARSRRDFVAEVEAIAIGLFAEHGYDAISVDTIAEAVGVSRTTLFRYFPLKEDIVLNSVRRELDELRRELDARPLDETAFEALRHVVLAAATKRVGSREAALMRVKVLAGAPALQARSLGEIYRMMDSVIDLLAVRLRVKPALDPRPGILAHAVFVTYYCMEQMWYAQDGDLPQIVGDVLDLLAAGLRTRVGR
jgi:AcrR family transcriptional regulator